MRDMNRSDLWARAALWLAMCLLFVLATHASAIEPVSRPVVGVERPPATPEEAAELRRLYERPLGRIRLGPGDRIEFGPVRDGQRLGVIIRAMWS